MIALAGFLFCVSFVHVFLRAAQQKNVVGGHYWFVGPVSLGMTFCEVYGVTKYVEHPDHKVLAATAIGVGAWLGCVAAMYLHNRIFTARG